MVGRTAAEEAAHRAPRSGRGHADRLGFTLELREEVRRRCRRWGGGGGVRRMKKKRKHNQKEPRKALSPYYGGGGLPTGLTGADCP